MTTKSTSSSRSKKSSHTADRGTDAIALLKSQHREVEEIFAKLEDTTERAIKTREQLVGELELKLEGHAQIEEQVFYPEGREVDMDMTLEAYEEHALVRHMLGELKAVTADDPTFKAKVCVLKELIEHHVEEEEKSFFPEMKKALGAEAIHTLGATMQQHFDEFLANPQPGPKTAKAAELGTLLPRGIHEQAVHH